MTTDQVSPAYTEEEKRGEYGDWEWLHDAAWRWVLWVAPHPGWDHDHCAFCHAHICDKPQHIGVLRECWHWDDPDESGNYESVCNSCFGQLRETFRWTVLEGLPGDPAPPPDADPPLPVPAGSRRAVTTQTMC